MGLLIIWLLVSTVLRNDLGSHIRYFSDDYDRGIYYERGLWLPNGQVPYRDVISEYPQVPTYLFGLFHIPFLGEKDELLAYLKHSSLFTAVMLVVLFALIGQIYRLLPTAKNRAFLLLLPAPLYFTLNRFDVLPAYLCMLSVVLIHNKKWNSAAVVLGIAAMTKWYPILLMPAFLAYAFQVERRINWQMIVWFAVTCFVIVLPTLLMGGVDALLVPYRFQGIRDVETLSLPALIGRVQVAIFQQPINNGFYVYGFLLLQASASFVSLFARIKNVEKLVQWCILIITTFVLFARIYSPQWILWILPFLILAARNDLDVAIIIIYGIVTYLGFPIIFDTFGKSSNQMILMSLMNSTLLAIIAGRAIMQIRPSEKNPVEPQLLAAS